MKKLLTLAAIVTTLSGVAQTGVSFPAMQGTSLDDKVVKLPVTNGKYSVIGIAFHRGAEDELKKWLNPLCDAFVKKADSKVNEMEEVHDVNFIFIPMISGLRIIKEDFKKGTDKEYWSYIMDTEKTDVKEVQKKLGVDDNKIPYFYVLDPQGKIIASVMGTYSEKKLTILEDAIE